MTLSRQNLVLAGLVGFISWGFITQWVPAVQYLGYAFFVGIVLAIVTLLGLILLTARKRPSGWMVDHSKGPPVAFTTPEHWPKEVERVRRSFEYQPKSLYPQSFVVSEGIDELLGFVTRDFVASWYKTISRHPRFGNEVDRLIRTAISNLRDILLAEDLVTFTVSRVFPIVTTHLREFDIAERVVRGRNLSRDVTESDELNLAIASKYRDGKLHPAASLSASDQKLIKQDHLRRIAVGLMPRLLPEGVLNSRIVSVLIREIIACAVLFPIVSMLSDPDSWNQWVEAYGHTALQDRKTVRKLRAALDEHALPVSKSNQRQVFPRLVPNDSERAFERFIKAIRGCSNLSDARRFRALIASQLKKEQLKKENMVADQDPVYIRRLETGKRVLDYKVLRFSAAEDQPSAMPLPEEESHDNKPQETTLIDLMHNTSGLSYFMEFMDRQGMMSLVQFWIVVDGFRNPLEDDFGDEMSSDPNSWTTADRNDMALMSETYLTKPELKVSAESRRIVKGFLSAGRRATSEQYRQARTVILVTQSAVLEELQNIYYPKFKNSDLYYKYLASEGASNAASRKSMQQPDIEQGSPSRRTSRLEKRPKLLSPTNHTSTGSDIARPKDRWKAAASSGESRNSMAKLLDEDVPARPSMDSQRSAPLFDDDHEDALVASTNSLVNESQNRELERKKNRVIETMEAALNDIIANEPNKDKADELKRNDLGAVEGFGNSPRSSTDSRRAEARSEDKVKPNIASLGLVDESSRRGVFDDDLFSDEQQKFIEDEYEEPEEPSEKDPADEVHEADPGDLGLTEAVESLTVDIEKLNSQDSVVDALTRKAELTNNTAELRILGKSKVSIQREIQRKEMQRRQYIIQESDNSLYGRSSIRIKNVEVGRESDGYEFAVCMHCHNPQSTIRMGIEFG